MFLIPVSVALELPESHMSRQAAFAVSKQRKSSERTVAAKFQENGRDKIISIDFDISTLYFLPTFLPRVYPTMSTNVATLEKTPEKDSFASAHIEQRSDKGDEESFSDAERADQAAAAAADKTLLRKVSLPAAVARVGEFADFCRRLSADRYSPHPLPCIAIVSASSRLLHRDTTNASAPSLLSFLDR